MKKVLYLPTAGAQATALCLMASPALACTTCDSALAQVVRTAVFGPDFWLNVCQTVLPFVIFLGITAGIYYGFPRGNATFKEK